MKLYSLRKPFLNETTIDSPRRPPPLTLRRQSRRNFPLQFFFCARPLKKIQKRKGKFLLGSALQVFGRCGGASTIGRRGIPSLNSFLPSCPRFGERAGGYLIILTFCFYQIRPNFFQLIKRNFTKSKGEIVSKI